MNLLYFVELKDAFDKYIKYYFLIAQLSDELFKKECVTENITINMT